MKIRAFLALAVALAFASPALAQTSLSPPTVAWGTTIAKPQPVQTVGYDRVTAAPCIVGSSASCADASGGDIARITVAPTVTAASAYAAGQAVGPLLTFENASRFPAGSGFIQEVTLNFKSAQTSQTDFVWCGSNQPTASAITDKTTVAMVDADYAKCRVIAHVADCSSLGTPTSCTISGLAVPFALSAGTSGYGFLITRGTPTFTTTSDVTVMLGMVRN